MLLANARIHEALRELLGELVKAGAALHGSGDGYDVGVVLRLGNQRLAEHAGVLWSRGLT